MKKHLLFLLFLSLIFQKALSQSGRVVGPAEKTFTDSLCATISRLDLSKINTAKEANSAFMDCFMKQSAMFEDVAVERNVTMDDNAAMHQMGLDIGKNLLKEKCEAFLKLASIMAKKDKNNEESSGTTIGTFKRIDLKGFNYIVINDTNQSEKSYLWLKQFPGSEKFIDNAVSYKGKQLKISWQEVEVYLPSAKGYYKIKEITAINLF